MRDWQAIFSAHQPRLMQTAFVAAFFALIALPLVLVIVPPERGFPAAENRLPAPAPNFAKILRGDGRMAPDLNRWFDDRVGFRWTFIRLYNEIDYSLFGHSNKVYIGRDGMLFDRAFLAAKVGAERAGDAQRNEVQERFLALARYLDRRNMRLVIVSNPSKASAYPQLLPADAPRFPAVTQFDKLRRFLRESPQWLYVDGQDASTSCALQPYFLRLDVHATQPSIFCIAKEIVSRIAVAEGRPAAYWNPNFTYHKERSYGGGLGRFMSLLRIPSELADTADSAFAFSDPTPEGSFEDDPNHFFEVIYRTHEPLRANKLPPTLLYGNSFANHYAHAGMYFQFADLYRVRSNGLPLEPMLSRIPQGTRYVVVQFLEVFLDDILRSRIPED